MRYVDWIFLAAAAVLLITMYVRRDMARQVMFLLGSVVCSSIAGLLGDSPVAIVMRVLGIGLLVWACVLGVRQTRAQWRKDMERVKHL